MKIFILEDDADQSDLYTYWLEDEHECKVFNKARELIKFIAGDIPDLLLIDWNLPIVDGLDVLHWLKGSRFVGLPVIFLTSRNAEKDMVRALTDGADDYVIKPVTEAVLKARINAVSRRLPAKQKNKQAQSDSKPYQFNNKTNSISFKNSTVTLTNKEFELALYFFNNEGVIIARDLLLEAIWLKSSSINTRTVDTHISRLRKKLRLDGSNGWKLVSIYHQGYKLINLTST
ncbi:MAG: response regulator transcription factor [Proteobacteria bacterium]|nr:response regulator transcription factor [Pseudomonadota bacterium]